MKCVRWEVEWSEQWKILSPWIVAKCARFGQAMCLATAKVLLDEVIAVRIIGYDSDGNSRVCFEWKVEDGR